MDRCLQCDGQKYYSANFEYYNGTSKFNIVFQTDLKYGKLGYCRTCKTHWYLDSDEKNIYPVTDWQMDYLEKWNTKSLIANSKTIELLKEIKATPIDIAGNNKEYIDFPCKVRINDVLHHFAIISFQKTPPVGSRFCKQKTIYFIDDVQDIFPSDFVLNNSIRYATANSPEIRMGFSPTVIKDSNENLYYLNWNQSFFDTDGLKGKDMILSGSFDFNNNNIKPSENILSKIIYIIGDWNDDFLKLRINAT